MECGLCGSRFDHLLPDGRAGACAACGALARESLLVRTLDQAGLLRGRVLDVGPSAAQVKHFPERLREGHYTAIDFQPRQFHDSLRAPRRFLEMSVSRMSFSDSSFDLILCAHVLQEVRSDFQAMSQIHRCLKMAGVAALSVPYTERKTDRSPEAWNYGVDFFERLEAAGLFPYRPPAELVPQPTGEAVFFAFKFRDAREKFREAV